jgi:hypothetical protein
MPYFSTVISILTDLLRILEESFGIYVSKKQEVEKLIKLLFGFGQEKVASIRWQQSKGFE